MKNYKWLVAVMMILVVAGAFTGCAKPPEAEKAAAKTALDAAIAAHADKYATTDYTAARQIWDSAESQVKEKKYEEAKKGYIDAKAAFEKAADVVETGKKAFTSQAAAAVADLEAAWTNLEAMAKKYENRLEKKKLWEGDSKTFLEGLTSARGMISTDPAGATEKAGQLKRFLDTYSALFKQLASAPVKSQSQAVRRKAKSQED
jgi:hypothetical protein